MKEIEILYKLEGDVGKSVDAVKISMGDCVVSRVVDTYYTRTDIDALIPNQDGRIFASFRTREKGEKKYITYKNDHFDTNGMWLYSDEYETSIGDTLVVQNILENLGFSKLVIIDNTKRVFKNNEFEIAIEDVKDLGNFIEIEYIGASEFADHQEVEKQKAVMRTYLESLGLAIGVEENAGKPELMLRALSVK